MLREIEDIYRPDRPKRKTRASVAKEKGLAPLAQKIYLQAEKHGSVTEIASEYVNPEKGVNTPDEAISGACDIIAEEISDNADYRKKIRSMTVSNGVLSVTAAKDEDSVYRMYYDFSESVKRIANHRILAVDRGEKEGFLKAEIKLDENAVTDWLKGQIVKKSIYEELLENAICDAYARLIAPSVEREIRSELSQRAEEGAIKLFAQNLKQLLMQPPIKGKTMLGLDPGYLNGVQDGGG